MKVIAFDCFGTVFDMSPIPREEITAYVQHVRKNDFTPYEFPKSWYNLKAHPDSRGGIAKLRAMGLGCVALSNGSIGLLSRISKINRIAWNLIIDLAKHRVYKPHADAYRTVEKETGFTPAECLMVTANPTFGDIEGAAQIGMPSRIIRNGYPETIIELADMLAANT
jgi:HAD superfamily hydrolase (TIGR01493 family)